MLLDLPVIKKGSFYFLKDGSDDFVLEDKTKRGLEVKETSVDEKTNILADKGMIHDMDGIGHWVPIRWYYSKNTYTISQVTTHAENMEKKYTELRELTCPDDDD